MIISFIFYCFKNITKVVPLLSMAFFSVSISSFAVEPNLTEQSLTEQGSTESDLIQQGLTEQTSQRADKVRMGQVIHKANLLKQPSYQSDISGSVSAKEKINIQKRKSAWYFISTETVPKIGQVSGWVSMLNVRFVATAKREGELGVESIFSRVTNDSLPTVSTGVRGFDENDLKNSKADLKQLLLLNTYIVSSGAAARFAKQGKLQANKIKVKED